MLSWKNGFLASFKSTQLPELTPILNREGQEGWRLVQILLPDLVLGAKSVEKLVAIFERPISI
jgi:hypothetical protein